MHGRKKLRESWERKEVKAETKAIKEEIIAKTKEKETRKKETLVFISARKRL